MLKNCRKLQISRKRELGAVLSIWFIIVFSILLSFFVVMIQSARSNTICYKTECIMDMGLYSIFAEYNRALLEKYDLFLLDSSYGAETADYHQIESHFLEYASYNIQEQKGLPIFGFSDLFGLSIDWISIQQMELATDNMSYAIKQQAIDQIKTSYGISFIEDLQNNLEICSDQEYTSSLYQEKVEDAEDTLQTAKDEGIQISEDNWIQVDIENPADEVNAKRWKGILTLTVEDIGELSQNAVDLSCCPSRRELSKGSGLTDEQGNVISHPEFSFLDDLIFHQYCFEHFSDYSSEKEDSALLYEIEYLIAGKNSDIQNLREVCNKLILLREAANITYLYTDSAKLASVQTLALAVTSALTVPYLSSLVELTIMSAWAYAESVVDVRRLLSGHKVPLIKTSEDWNVSLEGMAQYFTESTDASQEEKEESGLDYRMYLRLLLAISGQDKVIMRATDLMEMTIRQTEGNQSFRMDACVSGMSAELQVSSEFGNCYSIRRTYQYGGA